MTGGGGRKGTRGWRRLLEWIVGWYPENFRALLGADLLHSFAEELERHRCRGRWAATRYALHAVASAAWGAAVERVGRPKRPRALWRTGTGWRDLLTNDGRQIVRSLGRSPGFSVAILGALAIGVGANVGAFERVDELLLRPPAYMRDPGAVHRLYVDRMSRGRRYQDGSFSYPAYRDLSSMVDGSGTLVAVFGGTPFVDAGGEPRPAPVDAVSGTYWSLFDARPLLGRFFGPADDRLPEGEAVAVISYGYWTTGFGADAGVLGRTLRVATRTYIIIGVAPEGFAGTERRGTIAWIPVTAAGAGAVGADFAARPFTTWLDLFVRPVPPASSSRLSTQLGRGIRAFYASVRDTAAVRAADPRMVLAPVIRNRGPYESVEARVSVWLFAMSVLLLVVACSNVATLMLSRALRRRHETAVRAALGIGPGRLVAGHFLESLVLAAAGGLAAGPVAYGVTRLLTVGFPQGRTAVTHALGLRAVVLGAAVVPLAGLLAAVLPALASRRMGPGAVLRSGTAGAGRAHTPLQAALVVIQAAMSTVLLVGAGLFLRSVQRISHLDLGYDPDRILVVGADPRTAPDDPHGVGSTTARRRTIEGLAQRARELHGVRSVALSATVPFVTNDFEPIYLADGTRVRGSQPPATHVVSGTYFETMGTPILRGRPLTRADDEQAPRVTVVSASLAASLWPGENPLGRCLRLGADTMPCSEVVGVAEDIRRGDIRDAGGLQYYTTWRQYYGRVPSLVLVRTDRLAAQVLDAVRRRLQASAPDVYVRVRRLDTVIAGQTTSWTAGASIFTCFGILALVLAAFGLFTVMAYDTSQRRRELALRVVVGARAPDLGSLVARRGIVLAGGGMLLGLAATWLCAPRVQPLLFDVSARDPWAFIAAAVLLGVSTALATLSPAVRAVRVDPQVVLRSE